MTKQEKEGKQTVQEKDDNKGRVRRVKKDEKKKYGKKLVPGDERKEGGEDPWPKSRRKLTQKKKKSHVGVNTTKERREQKVVKELRLTWNPFSRLACWSELNDGESIDPYRKAGRHKRGGTCSWGKKRTGEKREKDKICGDKGGGNFLCERKK